MSNTRSIITLQNMISRNRSLTQLRMSILQNRNHLRIKTQYTATTTVLHYDRNLNLQHRTPTATRHHNIIMLRPALMTRPHHATQTSLANMLISSNRKLTYTVRPLRMTLNTQSRIHMSSTNINTQQSRPRRITTANILTVKHLSSLLINSINPLTLRLKMSPMRNNTPLSKDASRLEHAMKIIHTNRPRRSPRTQSHNSIHVSLITRYLVINTNTKTIRNRLRSIRPHNINSMQQNTTNLIHPNIRHLPV